MSDEWAAMPGPEKAIFHEMAKSASLALQQGIQAYPAHSDTARRHRARVYKPEEDTGNLEAELADPLPSSERLSSHCDLQQALQDTCAADRLFRREVKALQNERFEQLAQECRSLAVRLLRKHPRPGWHAERFLAGMASLVPSVARRVQHELPLFG